MLVCKRTLLRNLLRNNGQWTSYQELHQQQQQQQRGRYYHSWMKSSSNNLRQPMICSVLTNQTNEDEHSSRNVLYQHQQIRYKRKGGASAFSKPRSATRKQRKAYHKRKRKLHYERHGKHSAPGSKAGERREFIDDEWQHLLDMASGKATRELSMEELEYDASDAMVDDLIGNTAFITSQPHIVPKFYGLDFPRNRNYIQSIMQQRQQFLQQQQQQQQQQHQQQWPNAK